MGGKLRVQQCEPLQLRYDTALIKGSTLLLNEQQNLPPEFRTTNTSNSAKMLSKLTVLFVAFTAALVGALPSTETQGSCSAGPVQCCMYFVLLSSCAAIYWHLSGNDVHSIDTTEAKSILKSYAVVVPVGTNVGFKCSPITGVGVGSSGWYAFCDSHRDLSPDLPCFRSCLYSQAQTVCCKDDSFSEYRHCTRPASVFNTLTPDGVIVVGCSPININV